MTFHPARPARLELDLPMVLLGDSDRDIKRLDPDGCGCTDCLTGYSKPINWASQELITAMVLGQVDNATGVTGFVLHVSVHRDDDELSVTGINVTTSTYDYGD